MTESRHEERVMGLVFEGRFKRNGGGIIQEFGGVYVTIGKESHCWIGNAGIRTRVGGRCRRAKIWCDQPLQSTGRILPAMQKEGRNRECCTGELRITAT